MRTLAKDTFTGTNGTAIADHTPNVGGPWTTTGAGLVIQSNKLTGSDASGVSSIPVGSRAPIMEIGYEANSMQNASYIGLELLDAAGNNGFEVFIFGDGSIKPDWFPASGILISEEIDGFSVAGSHRIRLQLGPQQASMQIDGVSYVLGPRLIAGDVVIDKLRVTIAVAAGNYPLLDNLVITG